MKGFMLKDLYCLRKQFRFFVLTTLATLYVAILFMISSEYGNVKHIVSTEELSNPATRFIMTQFMITLAMFIPIALGERVTGCFLQDAKSGFNKVFYTVPVSNCKKVGSRYLITLIYIALGALASLIIGIFLTITVKEWTFIMTMRTLLVLVSLMIMLMSLILFGCYLLGSKRANLASGGIICGLMIGGYITGVMKTVNYEEKDLLVFVEKMKWFLNEAGIELFMIFVLALICITVSYVLSMLVINRKTGKI